MTGDLWPSAFVAAVFAVHPLRAESVAWVAERKDVLSGLFFMLTLAAYVGYVRRPVFAGTLSGGGGAVRLGPDGQADVGHAAVGAAAVGLLAAGADGVLGNRQSKRSLGWQLHCHPRGGSATATPTKAVAADDARVAAGG